MTLGTVRYGTDEWVAKCKNTGPNMCNVLLWCIKKDSVRGGPKAKLGRVGHSPMQVDEEKRKCRVQPPNSTLRVPSGRPGVKRQLFRLRSRRACICSAAQRRCLRTWVAVHRIRLHSLRHHWRWRSAHSPWLREQAAQVRY